MNSVRIPLNIRPYPKPPSNPLPASPLSRYRQSELSWEALQQSLKAQHNKNVEESVTDGTNG